MTQASGESAYQPRVPLAALLAVLGAWPLLIPAFPQLMDWSRHLARIRILADLDNPQFQWRTYYDFSGYFAPNAALDWTVAGLIRLGLDADLAGRAFLLLIYAVFIGGFRALAAAAHADGPLKTILAIWLFFNGGLFFGLISYQLGLGVMMLCLAAWIRGGTTVRIGLAAAGTALLFWCHLVAAFLFAGIAGCLDLMMLWRTRGRGWRQCHAVLALAAALLLRHFSPAGNDTLGAVWVGGGSMAGFVYWKASLIARPWLGGAPVADVVFAVATPTILILAALGTKVRLSGGMGLAVLMTALLVLAAPQRVGVGTLLDQRLAVVPVLLAAATMRLEPISPAWARALFGAVALAVFARATVLTAIWSRDDRVFARLERHLMYGPSGGILLSGLGRPIRDVSWREYWSPAVEGAASLGVAHGWFVPTVFADARQQVLSLKPAFRPWNVTVDVTSPDALAWRKIVARPLCEQFSGAVRMLIVHPAKTDLPGMIRIGDQFGMLDLCAPG